MLVILNSQSRKKEEFKPLSPDGKTAYVTNYGGTVSVIDTATNLVTSSVTVGIYTTFPAVDHNTGLVYVPSLGDGTISVISPTG